MGIGYLPSAADSHPDGTAQSAAGEDCLGLRSADLLELHNARRDAFRALLMQVLRSAVRLELLDPDGFDADQEAVDVLLRVGDGTMHDPLDALRAEAGRLKREVADAERRRATATGAAGLIRLLAKRLMGRAVA